MREFEIVVKQEVGTIQTNFEEIKEQLVEQMEIYKSLEVTEENKTERKKDIAVLRKMLKAVSDKRIQTKNDYLKAYEVTDLGFKELTAIINEPINLLDFQVKEFEEKQRQEKISQIKVYFEAKLSEYDFEIDLQQVYDGKWENSSVSLKKIKEEIDTQLFNVSRGLETLKAMSSEKTEQAILNYLGTLDLPTAINLIQRYESQKREIEERLAKEKALEEERRIKAEQVRREQELELERERIRKEERERIAVEERIKEEERRKVQEEINARLKADEEEKQKALEVKRSESELISKLILITATIEEIEQVKMYMNSIGVEFKEV
jgi:hypothetical protein